MKLTSILSASTDLPNRTEKREVRRESRERRVIRRAPHDHRAVARAWHAELAVDRERHTLHTRTVPVAQRVDALWERDRLGVALFSARRATRARARTGQLERKQLHAEVRYLLRRVQLRPKSNWFYNAFNVLTNK